MVANYVEIKIKAENDASANLAVLKEQLDALGRKVAEARVSVDDKVAAAKLLAINAALTRMGRTVETRVSLTGAAAMEARLALLNAQLDKLGGGAGGGILAAKLGALPVAAWGGLVPVAAALLPLILGIVPAIVAAGLGLAAFGAIALPTFTAVTAAAKPFAGLANVMTSQWGKIPAALQPAVESVLKFQNAWSDMVTKLQPLAAPVIATLAGIGTKLLPFVQQFAQAAAPAIEGLLRGLDRFTSSSGFKSFMDTLLKLSPGAITAIGEGLGRIAVALGKLLLAMVTPQSVKALTVILTTLADLITIVAKVIGWLGKLPGAFGAATDAGKRNFRFLAEAASGAVAAMIGAFLRWTGEVRADMDKVLGFFQRLPGWIRSALGPLGNLLVSAGRQLISGLISGILAMLGPLGGVIAHVLGLIGSITGAASSASSAVSGLNAPGNAPHPPGGVHRGLSPAFTTAAHGGHTHHLIISFSNAELMRLLKTEVRTGGGDPSMFTRKVKFA